MRSTLTVVTLALFVLAGCSQSSSDPALDPSADSLTGESTTTIATVSTICEELSGGGTRCSLVTAPSDGAGSTQPNDVKAYNDAVVVLTEFMNTWNEDGVAFAGAYVDDAVSVSEYIEIGFDTLAAYRTGLSKLVFASNGFPEPLAPSVNALIANYEASAAAAFTKILEAEVARDNNAWQAAADEYYAISTPEVTLSLIESIVTTPEATVALETDGRSVAELMEALRLSWGVNDG